MHEAYIRTSPCAKTIQGTAESPQRQCCHPRLCSVSQLRSKGYYSTANVHLGSLFWSQEMVRQQMEAQRVEMQLASEAVFVCSSVFLLFPG